MPDPVADGQVGGLDAQSRSYALDVLTAVLAWRLTQWRWEPVWSAVTALTSAVAGGHATAVRTAAYSLELVGPVRTTGFDDDPMVPPPEPLLDEINELIVTLDGRRPAAPQD